MKRRYLSIKDRLLNSLRFYGDSKRASVALVIAGIGMGPGARVFVNQFLALKKLGWNVELNPRNIDKFDFVVCYFRPVPSSESAMKSVVSLDSRKLIVYLNEPLDLRKETWSPRGLKIDLANDVLDKAIRIFVNSSGIFECENYEELKAFSKYLDKVVVVPEALVSRSISNVSRKLHFGNEPSLVWHGHVTNLHRWVYGRWPDKEFDPKYYPNLGVHSSLKNYGDLRDTLRSKINVIASPSSGQAVDLAHPGDINLCRALKNFDIGLAPFRTDTYRTVTKPFGTKIQSYMVAGLPVIASPVTDYCCWIEHGYTGLFADSKKEWQEAKSSLGSADLRNKLSMNAREMVLSNFSEQKLAAFIERKLEEII